MDGKLISKENPTTQSPDPPPFLREKVERKKAEEEEEERRGKDRWSGSLLAQENPVINSRKKR